MIVHINQPYYLPTRRIMSRIVQSDIYVILDHLQFSFGGFYNRAKWLNGNRECYLTIPVVHRLGQTFCEAMPANTRWIAKHRKTVGEFDDFLPWTMPDASIADIGHASVRWHLGKLKAAPDRARIFRSSELIGKSDQACYGENRAALLERILKEIGATALIFGPGTASYKSSETLDRLGITPILHDPENMPANDFPMMWYMKKNLTCRKKYERIDMHSIQT